MSAEPNFNETEYELLSAYLDGELADEQRAALESRLAAEPALRAELNALRTTVALINGLPPLKAPRDFTLSVELLASAERAASATTAAPPQPTLVQLTGEPRSKRRSRAPWYTLAGVAAALLLVFGLLSLLSSNIGSIFSDISSSLQGGAAAGAPPQIANAPTATPALAFSPTLSGETPVMLFSATQSAANTLPATAQPPQPETGTGATSGIAASVLTVTAANEGAQRSSEAALIDATSTAAAGMAMDSAPAATLTQTPAGTPIAPPEEDDGITAMQAFVTVTPQDQGVDLMQAAPAMTATQVGLAPPGEPEVAGVAPVTEAAVAEEDAQEQPSDAAVFAESATEEAPQTAVAQSAPTASRTPQPTASVTPAPTASVTPDAAAATAAILGIEPAFWVVLLIAALLMGIGVAFWFMGRRAR